MIFESSASALAWIRNQTSDSGNFARYHFELLREIRGGDRIHYPELIADDSLQCSFKSD
jgi:hypothetical protein